jgi:hypothetical protein
MRLLGLLGGVSFALPRLLRALFLGGNPLPFALLALSTEHL